MLTRVASSADVSETAVISAGVQIWHLAQVRDQAIIGPYSILGRGCYVGSGVSVGENCKIQNYSMIYEPATLENGVFIGPGAVLTNDEFPRAINPDGSQKQASDWKQVGVYVCEGASIGARAVCVAPVRIGRWSLVAAGAVVINDVPDYALVAGVPARRIKWVGKAGVPLEFDGERWVCPQTGQTYKQLSEDKLKEVET